MPRLRLHARRHTRLQARLHTRLPPPPTHTHTHTTLHTSLSTTLCIRLRTRLRTKLHTRLRRRPQKKAAHKAANNIAHKPLVFFHWGGNLWEGRKKHSTKPDKKETKTYKASGKTNVAPLHKYTKIKMATPGKKEETKANEQKRRKQCQTNQKTQV